jgi:hypothetical protein
MDEWAGLLGVPSFKDIEQVKSYILEKCAESFLAGTLPNIEFNSLIVNRGAVAALKLEELEAAVEAVAPPPVVDVPAEDEAAVRAPLADLLAPTPFVPDVEKTHDGATSAAAPSNLSEVKENTRPDANPPSLGKTPSVSQLAKELVKQICENDKYKAALTKDLGASPYPPLHIFLSMHARNPKFLNEKLQKIAAKTKTLPMHDRDFIDGYIKTLKEARAFLDTTKNTPTKTYNAFDLACVAKDPYFAMLLLEKGSDLGAYTNKKDNLHSAMRHNALEVMKKLLPTVGPPQDDWYYLILKAMKYCNAASSFLIDHYLHNPILGVIKDVRDRYGGGEESIRYTVLNKVLLNINDLVKTSQNYNPLITQETRDKAFNKVIQLLKFATTFLSSEKVYYAEDNPKVMGKGVHILDALVRLIHEIEDNQKTKKIKDPVKDIILSIVNKYTEFKDLHLSEHYRVYLDNLVKYVKKEISKLENLSQASYKTSASQSGSVLSRLDEDEQNLDGFEEDGFEENPNLEELGLLGDLGGGE